MYQRTENRGSYNIVTTVCDNGDYTQFIKWADGERTNYRTDNIFRMGWASLAEFLKERPRFVKIETAEEGVQK